MVTSGGLDSLEYAAYKCSFTYFKFITAVRKIKNQKGTDFSAYDHTRFGTRTELLQTVKCF